MKTLPLESVSFRYVLRAYAEWLDILGYAATTVASLPVHVRELLHYLEGSGVASIPAIRTKHISAFVAHLRQRNNQRQGGALSASSINKIVLAVNSFNRYLRTTGKHDIDIVPAGLQADSETRIILTREEVQHLFEASFVQRRGAGLAYGQRDRAMLTVLYGCGLRRNEARQLDVADVLVERSLLHVRNGKGSKQRLVPVTPAGMDYLTAWLDEGRPWLLGRTGKSSDALLVSQRGERMLSFYQRLGLLHQVAGLDKPLSPHVLRHSIATHLLHAGMDIEAISQFLGHSTLESTQIYTHIVDEYGHQL